MKYKIVIFKSNLDGQWYWHLKARNGEIIAQSEAYKTRGGARRTVNTIANKLGATITVLS